MGTNTFSNFNSAVSEIANARLPPSSGIALYKLKALPRLSCIPQLCTHPSKTAQIEKHAIETILHVAHVPTIPSEKTPPTALRK